MRTDPLTWHRNGVKPTEDDLRRARIWMDCTRMLDQWWETPPDDMSQEDAMLACAAGILWELAADEDGNLSTDDAKQVYEDLGLALTALVD